MRRYLTAPAVTALLGFSGAAIANDTPEDAGFSGFPKATLIAPGQAQTASVCHTQTDYASGLTLSGLTDKEVPRPATPTADSEEKQYTLPSWLGE